jgi:two-component system chemotaxis response regulator CheB
VRKIEKFKPDVITLDLELPRMDGLTFLRELMSKSPIPVVVISSAGERGSRKAIEALEAGAVEVISKPDVSSPEKLSAVSQSIHEAIRAAFHAEVRKKSQGFSRPILNMQKPQVKNASTRIIAIGASTGGTEAIKDVLRNLPSNCPGIVIVQHMPEMFTRSFAERLNSLSIINVKEAEEGDEVLDGRALIAPGNKHMTIVNRNGKYVVRLNAEDKVNRHRPSVDVLFRSVAQVAASNAMGILLTGMGEDGAAGLLEIKSSDGYTIAQDRSSSVVFGMPRRAIEIGAACEIFSITQIAKYIQTEICSYEK